MWTKSQSWIKIKTSTFFAISEVNTSTRKVPTVCSLTPCYSSITSYLTRNSTAYPRPQETPGLQAQTTNWLVNIFNSNSKITFCICRNVSCGYSNFKQSKGSFDFAWVISFHYFGALKSFFHIHYKSSRSAQDTQFQNTLQTYFSLPSFAYNHYIILTLIPQNEAAAKDGNVLLRHVDSVLRWLWQRRDENSTPKNRRERLLQTSSSNYQGW